MDMDTETDTETSHQDVVVDARKKQSGLRTHKMIGEAEIRLDLDDAIIEANVLYDVLDKDTAPTDRGWEVKIRIENIRVDNVTQFLIRIIGGHFATVDETDYGVPGWIRERAKLEILDNYDDVVEQIIDQFTNAF